VKKGEQIQFKIKFTKKEVFMNGKINIIFGFIYFALTAVLGPTMLVPHMGVSMQAMKTASQAVDKVKEDVQKGNQNPDYAGALSGIMDYLKSEKTPGKGAHAHGNLEALLNIAVGLVLITLAIPVNFKTLLSIIFLVGAVFHSGMLYLGGIFHMYWAYNFTIIGAIAIIAGLVGMGIASFIGIKQTHNQ